MVYNILLTIHRNIYHKKYFQEDFFYLYPPRNVKKNVVTMKRICKKYNFCIYGSLKYIQLYLNTLDLKHDVGMSKFLFSTGPFLDDEKPPLNGV